MGLCWALFVYNDTAIDPGRPAGAGAAAGGAAKG